MKLLLPTAYFPPISYFSDICRHDELVIETQETFPKQTLRNRCEIATSQGSFRLSVPLAGRSNKSKAFEVRIAQTNWRELHWKSIMTAYGSSPFFIFYEQEIRALLNSQQDNLIAYNTELLKGIFKLLKLNKSIIFTSVYETEFEGTNRRNFHKSIVNPYHQVFNEKTGFINDLSILDLIFNLGPQSLSYLQR